MWRRLNSLNGTKAEQMNLLWIILNTFPTCIMKQRCWLFLVLNYGVAKLAEAGGNSLLDRHLAIGDFDELNELIEGAVVKLPNIAVNQDFVSLYAKNIRCHSFRIGDVRMPAEEESSQRVTVEVGIESIDMICFFDYEYSAIFLFSGRGSAEIYLDDNAAYGKIGFHSPSFSTSPPNRLSFESCRPEVNIVDMVFDGGIVAFVLNSVEETLRRRVESEVEKEICDELSSFAETKVSEILRVAESKLAQFPSKVINDPLALERSLGVRNGTKLLNLQDKNESFGKWLHFLLEEGVAFLSESVPDPSGPNDKDMNANIFLRDNLLQKRALAVNISDLPIENKNGLIWEGIDRLTETQIFLENIKLLGLDTMTKFEPLQTIGDQTVQTKISWDYLAFELDVSLIIKPSTRKDSVIANPGSRNVVERVKIAIGFDKVDAIMSLLLAIDQDAIGEANLGSLLRKETILPCLLSTIFQTSITGLSVKVKNVKTPQLDGLLSSGIDRVLNSATEAAFLMYEGAMLESASAFFQTTVKDLLNKNVLDKYINSGHTKDTECTWGLQTTFKHGLMDFRDLFLPPDLARATGASGANPYGDLISTVLWPMFEDKLLSQGDDALPIINSGFIRPLTKIQSGEEGELLFPSDFFHLVKHGNRSSIVQDSLFERATLRAFHLRLFNVDTLTPPVSLLRPTQEHVLTNSLKLGPVPPHPFGFTMRWFWSIEGKDSPISMRNEVELRVLVESFEFLIETFLAIHEEDFLEFPLSDISNPYCWLATIPASGVGDQDNIYLHWGVDLSRFLISLSKLSIDLTCISCTSKGIGASLSQILAVLEEAHFFFMIQEHLEKLGEELVSSYWDQLPIGQLLAEAPKLCPHSTEYNESMKAPAFAWPSFPRLSRSSLETMVSLLTVGCQVAAIAIAKSHLPTIEENSMSSPLQSGQVSASGLLDWTDPNGSLGPWASVALEKFLIYLGSNIDNNSTSDGWELRINSLIRDSFLADQAMLVLDFIDEGSGPFHINSVQIFGLDSISALDMFKPLTPTGLESRVIFDHLDFIIDIGINTGKGHSEEEQITFTLKLEEVAFNFALLAEVDGSSLGGIEVGSLLHSNQIIPCMMSSFNEVAIPGMYVTVRSIGYPHVHGFESDDLQNGTFEAMKSILGAFHSDVYASIPAAFDVTVRKIFNAILLKFHRERAYCSLYHWNASGFVDFRDLMLPGSLSSEFGGSGTQGYGDIFPALFQSANAALDVDTINNWLANWAKNQSNISGTLSHEQSVLDTNATFDLGYAQATAGVEVYGVTLENLDSVGNQFKLLQPVKGQPNALDSATSFGVGPKPVRVSATVLMWAVDKDSMQVRNEVKLAVILSEARVFLRLLLKVSEQRFLSFPLRDILNLHCWIVNVLTRATSGSSGPSGDGVDLIHHAWSLKQLDLNVSCISCTSPDFDDLVSHLYKPDESKNGTSLLKEWGAYGSQFLKGDFVRDFLLIVSAKQCPHHPAYDPNATTSGLLSSPYDTMDFEVASRDKKSMAVFNVVCASVAIFLFLLVATGKWIFGHQNQAWIKSLPSKDIFRLDFQQKLERDEDSGINGRETSLFHSPQIPYHVRCLVPLVIVADIGLFLGGHLGPICDIGIDAQVAGEDITINEFFGFSFFRSTLRTYSNGGNEVAVFCFIFSGLWPYLKLVTLLVMWFTPPRKLKVSRRRSVLLWMDVFAKLSIVDIFVMIVTISAFLVYVGGPDKALTDEGKFYSIKLVVVPQGGFYCFLVAQKISRVLSRFIFDYHCKVETFAVLNQRENDGSKRIGGSACLDKEEDDIQYWHNQGDADPSDKYCSFAQAQLACLTRSETEEGPADARNQAKIVTCLGRFGGTAGVVFAGLAVLALGTIGCMLAPSISLDTRSLWGIAESRKSFEQAVKTYGVFHVVSLVLLHARFVLDDANDYAGLGVLLVLVVIFAVIFPLINGLLFMKKCYHQRAIQKENEVGARKQRLPKYMRRLFLWKDMEIYITSFVLSSWQLGAMSAYVIHSYCALLERIYDSLVYIGLLENTHAYCFGVQSFLPSTVVIVCGGFLFLLVSFFYQAAVQYTKNKDRATIIFKRIKCLELEYLDKPIGETEETESSIFRLDSDI